MKRKPKFMRLALEILPAAIMLVKLIAALVELVSKVANYGRQFFQFRVQLSQSQK